MRRNAREGKAMAIATAGSDLSIPWWKEPTKDQWLAWIAASLGWMLDALGFIAVAIAANAIAVFIELDEASPHRGVYEVGLEPVG